jgi:ankyrin repeat protein
MIGDLAKVQLLLQKGIQREHDELRAAVFRNNPALTRWLVETGSDIEARNKPWENTALIQAASFGATKSMEILIGAGADVQAKGELGRTALGYAQNAETIRLLVKQGADINHIDGYSRLIEAVENGESEVVRTLLELGADPNVSSTKLSALHTAVLHDQLEIMQLLLEAGANPNSKYDEWFPLSYTKTIAAAQLLLEFGAEIHIENNFRATALSHLDNREIIDFLKSH